MSDLGDKAQGWLGKAKEKVGEVIGDDKLENEGRADQVKSDIKEAVSDVGDKAKEAADKVLGAFKKDDDKKDDGVQNQPVDDVN